MSDIKREFVFKIVLMGEGSVGKTSIRSKFMGVGFKSEYIKTIGADFASKAIELGENKVHFQIWDLAGQKMYRHVRSSFYSGCKCGFLVFDLTQPVTLVKLEEWAEEAIAHSGGFLKIFIVLGNKSDLKDQIKIKDEEIKKLIEKLRKKKNIEAAYLATSAKTGENIAEAFEMMGKMFLEKEGFPFEGQGTEIDDETLEKHHHEVQKLITVPNAPTQEEKAIKVDNIDLSELESAEIQFVIKTVMKKISQLTEITIALEERLLNVETKKVSAETTAADITELKEKISSLENQLEIFSIDTDSPIDETVFDDTKISEMTDTIPVPSINDITASTKKEQDTSFEALDRSSLELMEILEENNNEERITDILKESEKEEITEDVVSVELEPPQKKKAEKKPKKDEEVKTKASKARCPKCGSKLSYIKQYDRWHCYRCKIYV
ncbi:MAG: GTP-binding protein [Candidatus Heimdallarchaeota archaeon]|nr:MAG: GTP-binding protein [Candidatus Heimdallarchaeota archaeon]